MLGWPVAHSLSPAIQNAALSAVGLGESWRYQLLPVPPELFAETVVGLASAGFRGVNVTIPHKQAALDAAREGGGAVSPRAERIGAANTLLFGADGTIDADNTDAPGLIETLRRHTNPEGASALVLGAGGSARAAVWALRDAGAADVAVWNRTPARAEELADELGARCVREPQAAAAVDILVNCTSLGLHDGHQLDALGMGRECLGSQRVVADFVYRAGAATELVAAARDAGIPAVGGLELLVAQGAVAFELFTGLPAPREAMCAAAGLCSAP